MNKINEKLVSTFGSFGIILLYLFRLIICILPFVMIGGNFFVSFLLITLNTFLPITSIVFWIWGLVCAIRGVQDIFAILYYIVFAVAWLPFYISIVGSFFNKNK